MKLKLQTIHKSNFFNSSLRKNYSKGEKTIGWPPLIISGPPGAGKVTF